MPKEAVNFFTKPLQVESAEALVVNRTNLYQHKIYRISVYVILLTNDGLTVRRTYIFMSIKNAKVIYRLFDYRFYFEIGEFSKHSNQRKFYTTAEFLC